MSSQPLTVVFGGGAIGNRDPWTKPEDLDNVYSILLKHNCTHIDSAQLYGESEATLGLTKAGEKFTIDTKWVGGFTGGGGSSRENIVKSGQESIKKLGVKQVDIFYLHSPDPKTPIEETLAGVQEIYQLGLFKRFGVSNFKPEAVQQVYDHCKEQGYVLPTVYQGNYSPVARRQETTLFPVLRKLGIAFYAYSPLAGGFLTKTPQQLEEGAGRFNDEVIGGMYKRMYVKPTLIKALETWASIAEQEGATKAELAYRWVTYNSPLKKENGDAIIIGASKHEQLEQTLAGIEKGKLSDKAVKDIDEIWEQIKDEAPLDNYNG
ncbi:hypothetical protein LTR84_004383 [Exophiala bonariae]|uniref:NADP-dependent oxidoreductase domain-containing protein n=1 Tax=Exophiala bonariae TaxID=1690606 RepID=A0AAV9N4S8_9EURO|nr:hypothetical protein LTR84_004383 [Exophiala bonariae]